MNNNREKNGQKQFRFLFMRDRRKRREEVYTYPDASKISPQERMDEIILRVRSLQRKGIWPCTDPSVLEEPVKLGKNKHEITLSLVVKAPSVNKEAKEDKFPPSASNPHFTRFSPKRKIIRK